MNPATITARDLLEDSNKTLLEKKKVSKEMHRIASATAKNQGVKSELLLRLKDYVHYRGRGWVDDNPLESEKGANFPDRVSPCFRRLLQIVGDLRKVGELEQLEPYLFAMRENGIVIDFIATEEELACKDPKALMTSVSAMDALQTDICNFANKIRDEDSPRSEEIDFTPKEDFKDVLDLYHSKMKGKDIEPRASKKISKLAMHEKAITRVIHGLPV